MKMIFRRLRGAWVTGLVWSGAWGLAAVGFGAGIGFSVTLAAAFGNRELGEVSVASFSLAGGAVAGALVTGIVLLSGLAGSPIELVINLGIAAILGGSTAFGMIKLARSAPPISEGSAPLLSHGDSRSLETDPKAG